MNCSCLATANKNVSYYCHNGVTTLSIMTFCIMTLSVKVYLLCVTEHKWYSAWEQSGIMLNVIILSHILLIMLNVIFLDIMAPSWRPRTVAVVAIAGVFTDGKRIKIRPCKWDLRLALIWIIWLNDWRQIFDGQFYKELHACNFRRSLVS